MKQAFTPHSPHPPKILGPFDTKRTSLIFHSSRRFETVIFHLFYLTLIIYFSCLLSLESCSFYKKFPSTHRRVVYQGNIRMLARSPSGAHCSRWYFTFKGNECSGPAPIDGIYATSGVVINSHRAVTFEGLCSGIASGIVNIELKVDACAAGYPVGDAHTSWNGNSRVIIEEVHPPQP